MRPKPKREERLRRHSHMAALSFNLVTGFTVATEKENGAALSGPVFGFS